MKMFSKKTAILLLAFAWIAGTAGLLKAQTQEPDVIELPEPKTPYGEGKNNALGFKVFINNFGFGIGGHYSRIVSPLTEITFTTGITGIRDNTEQSFQDFFTGQRIIPNKFNRAIGFPMMLGIKHRLFASEIDDNFRLFISGDVGPALAFVYPYLEDIDGSGFRSVVSTGGFARLEPVNDFFSGWEDGELKWGASGQVKIGVNIGENFSKLTTVEFGYFFYYFDQGIQIMEPFKPIIGINGNIVGREPFFDDQKFFGSPQISITFGGMW